MRACLTQFVTTDNDNNGVIVHPTTITMSISSDVFKLVTVFQTFVALMHINLFFAVLLIVTIQVLDFVEVRIG